MSARLREPLRAARKLTSFILVVVACACISHSQSSSSAVPPVTGFKAVKVAPYSVTLQWDKPSGAVVLKRGSTTLPVPESRASFTDDKVSPSTKYVYSIVVTDDAGVASAVQTLRVKTDPPPPVLANGVYRGKCVDTGHSPGLSGVQQVEPDIQWHFTVLSDNRVKLFSASGGYSITLARTGDAKFYGSGSVGGGWERAINLTATNPNHDGVAGRLVAMDYDSTSFGSTTLFDKVTCKVDHA